MAFTARPLRVLFLCLTVMMLSSTRGLSAAPKGKPVVMSGNVTLPEFESLSANHCQSILYHDGDFSLVFTWLSPNRFGDTMQFTRFTPPFSCTLKTVSVWVADTADGAKGAPGLTVEIYSADGLFPDTIISSMSVPYDSLMFWRAGPTVVDFSAQNLIFGSDFCVVMRRSGTAADTMLLISDTSSAAGNMRSGEFTLFGGLNDWELMVDGWGVDIDFMVQVEMCCATTGDVDCDGTTDLRDLVLHGNALDGLIALTDSCSQSQADVDSDGDIDEDDYNLLYDVVAGK